MSWVEWDRVQRGHVMPSEHTPHHHGCNLADNSKWIMLFVGPDFSYCEVSVSYGVHKLGDANSGQAGIKCLLVSMSLIPIYAFCYQKAQITGEMTTGPFCYLAPVAENSSVWGLYGPQFMTAWTHSLLSGLFVSGPR